METSQQQGALNFSSDVFNKLTIVECFGIFIPYDAKNIHLVILKKESVTKVCCTCGHKAFHFLLHATLLKDKFI